MLWFCVQVVSKDYTTTIEWIETGSFSARFGGLEFIYSINHLWTAVMYSDSIRGDISVLHTQIGHRLSSLQILAHIFTIFFFHFAKFVLY